MLGARGLESLKGERTVFLFPALDHQSMSLVPLYSTP